MKNIAVIPARSGSKGLKNKNIKKLNKKPLMAYSIEAAQKAGIFDCIHVSTDSEQYAELARQYGAEVLFLRDSANSSDAATTWDAMRFVLREYKNRGKDFDAITVLQPTSPLRTCKDICSAYELFLNKQADSVIGVSEMEHSPLWSNTLPEDGCLEGYLRPELNGPRQNLSEYYRINGAIYIIKTQFLLECGNLYGKHGYAYIMPKERSIDIDDEMDFTIAEFLIKRRDCDGGV